ncbi:YhcN/YlaJ family sporulation lipoprotein [Paenibacillus physcomitrellae]|uniref:Lipoprotein YlaJ n=1 Tax=Paenibacillus physcomitrellae TaxID=1619311 RepID=A0ABQ1FL22_9BACL|nr:YhcN/YlaJ family sporulation lipoprotein [Paenibacillus physcomitrellae]GGA20679.1 putative lipoprotein YlaJ [Paenibacillus physcomitrellae]
MRSWTYILAAAIAFAALSGCGANKGANQADQARNQTQRMESTGQLNAQQRTQQIHQQQTNPGAAASNGNGNQTGQLAADAHLEQLASRVPGVKGAHVVMLGKTAIIGIDVDGKLDRSRVGTIKYSVAEAVHKDPRGANAIVTADADVSNRLAEIGSSIREGRPIEGMANELADLVGRIVPQLPSDVKQNEDNQQITSPGDRLRGQNVPNNNQPRRETPAQQPHQQMTR